MHPYLDNKSDIRHERIRPIPAAFFRNAGDMNCRETAFVVMEVLLGDEIKAETLKELVDASIPADAKQFTSSMVEKFVAAMSRKFSPDASKAISLRCPAADAMRVAAIIHSTAHSTNAADANVDADCELHRAEKIARELGLPQSSASAAQMLS
jgi:hypothetical protein